MTIISFDVTHLTKAVEELQSLIGEANYESVLSDLPILTFNDHPRAHSTRSDLVSLGRPQTRTSSSNHELIHNRDSDSDQHEQLRRISGPTSGLLFSIEPRRAMLRHNEDSSDGNRGRFGLSDGTIRELVIRIGDATIEILNGHQE